MVPGRDRTRDPWICSQTRYRLCYAARYTQATIFYSSLDTFINANTTLKGGAPAQAEYTSKKERMCMLWIILKKDTKTSSIRYKDKFRNCQLTMLNVHFRYAQVVQ